MRRLPDSGDRDDGSLPAAQADGIANTGGEAARASFEIKLRGRTSPASTATVVREVCSRLALDRSLARDVSDIAEPILSWRRIDQLVALDFDRPDDEPQLEARELTAFFPPTLPQPAATWTTHGGGLRAIYASSKDATATERGGAWFALGLPPRLAAFRVELKTDSRHPKGLRDGVTCGEIITYPEAEWHSFPRTGTVGSEEVQAWLEDHNLGSGRWPATSCPWNPKSTSGNDPVRIDEWGIRCFHCGRSAPWSRLIRGDSEHLGPLHAAARAWVHLPHQRHVIRAYLPSMPEGLIKPAWSLLLRVANADRLSIKDPSQRASWQARLEGATGNVFDIARTNSGAWVDATTLRARRVTPERTLKHLPSCLAPTMVDEAADTGVLRGYVPIHPLGATQVVGPYVNPSPGSVFARAAPGAVPAVNLRDRPSDEQLEEAVVFLREALPGCDTKYLALLISVMLAGQRSVGTPPIVVVTGQSGSAKTAQIHLAAGALGTQAKPIALHNADDMTRQIGLALEGGAGCLFIDEIGRHASVFYKLEPLVAANSQMVFRPKYSNERQIELRAPIVLLGSTVPDAILHSPEFARRSVGIRLRGAEKSWVLTDPTTNDRLDLCHARRHPLFRKYLDIITADLWWRLSDAGPGVDWRKFVQDFGVVPLPELDLTHSVEKQDRAIRLLYEAFRTAAPHQLKDGGRYAGWAVVPGEGRLHDAFGVLVDLDGNDERRHAQTSDIERLNLHMLGFKSPELQLMIRKHSGRFYFKFVEPHVMRGRGLARAMLPALDSMTDPPCLADEVVV